MALPYDTAQTALNVAIIAANDGGGPNGMGGNVLNPLVNLQVLPALQERWRYLQQRLISAGVDTFTKDQVISSLPATTNPNPRSVMILTYGGMFDGVIWTGPTVSAPIWSNAVTYTQGMTVTFGTVSPPISTFYVALPNSATNLNQEPDSSTTFWQPFSNVGPTLPSDLVKPLEIWECPTGGNAWVRMTQLPDSLPSHHPMGPRFGVWLFQNDELILPPSSQTNDLRIKYLAMAPDISTLASPLMVRGCTTALAYLMLDQVAGGRGGPMAETFKARAEEAINQILNQTVRKMLYAQYVRKPYRGGSNRRPSGGWGI
jgi:hypothetical protein